LIYPPLKKNCHKKKYNSNDNFRSRRRAKLPNYQSFPTEKRLTRIQDSYKLGYLAEDVKVQYKDALNVSLNEIVIDSKEGDIGSIPRWLAQTLSESGAVTIQDRDDAAYVSRTLNLERIARAHDLSGINTDFYIRVNDYLSSLDERDRERIIVSLNSFVVSRIEKIVKLAAATTLTPAIREKLSVEERELYDLIHESTAIFKKKVLKKFD
jgi:DNA replication factor GINS